MNLSVFLKHQWLSFWRARNANKSLAIQIILGVFYFLIFLEIAAVGIILPFLLKEKMPNTNPISIYTSYLIYYFLIGLLARFQLQELPSLSIQPYLSQNIRRKYLLRFLNARSLVHFINFLPLFVFIPFIIVVVAPSYGPIAAICFFIALFSLVLNNHFLNMYIKRKTINNAWFFFAVLVFIAALKGLDYFKLLSFEKASSSIFISILKYPILCLVPVGMAIFVFIVNNKYLKTHLYIEELVSENKKKESKNFTFLNRLGDIGEMIALDLKLIFRNKRPKSLIVLSAALLLYGFLFYPKYLATNNFSMLFFFALLITGIFISNYGQFLFSWQSSHFDGMMTYNTNMHQYIKAKFSLFLTVCSLQFLIASFYGLMSWRLLPIQLAAYLYSVGVNSFVTIYVSTFNYRYLDLRKSASMNFQGIGAMQWLQSLLITFGPALVFYLLDHFVGFWYAVLGVSLPGVAGLIFHESIINWLVSQFKIRKYKILEGFRER